MNVGQQISDRSCRLGSRGICQTLIKKAGGDLAIVVTMAPVFRFSGCSKSGGTVALLCDNTLDALQRWIITVLRFKQRLCVTDLFK